jgi:hypothetical protein
VSPGGEGSTGTAVDGRTVVPVTRERLPARSNARTSRRTSSEDWAAAMGLTQTNQGPPSSEHSASAPCSTVNAHDQAPL